MQNLEIVCSRLESEDFLKGDFVLSFPKLVLQMLAFRNAIEALRQQISKSLSDFLPRRTIKGSKLRPGILTKRTH
jgi:hypothetical protein